VAAKPQTLIQPRSAKAKGRIKSSTIAVYASVFVLLVVLISIGYRTPQQVSGVANAAPSTATVPSTETPSAVNDVVASSIAASVATTTNLSVAPSVASLAISTQIQSELPSSTDSSISKPQIIEVSSASRKITAYTVVAGDTVDSVAAKFGISKQTLKWANNLVSDNLTVGTALDVLPREGISYTVKAGDTAESIAEKYKSDATSIISYNDLELAGISTGLKIIVPNGVLPGNERPGYVAPYVAPVVYGYSGGFGGNSWRIKIGTPMYAGNTYYTGNCTAYAFDRRVELGLPISASWGNATTWDNGARAAGLNVTNIPTVGAIMQNEGGYGHVAIVEKILPNGDVEVSEMNAFVSGGGWNIVSGRTISAALVNQYAYIK
jgi:surface antigen/LysM repeat protein